MVLWYIVSSFFFVSWAVFFVLWLVERNSKQVQIKEKVVEKPVEKIVEKKVEVVKEVVINPNVSNDDLEAGVATWEKVSGFTRDEKSMSAFHSGIEFWGQACKKALEKKSK